jgi:hypothetical protein
VNPLKAKLRVVLLAGDQEIAETDDPTLWQQLLAGILAKAAEQPNRGEPMDDAPPGEVEEALDLAALPLPEAIEVIMTTTGRSMRVAEIIEQLGAGGVDKGDRNEHAWQQLVRNTMTRATETFANTNGLFSLVDTA